MAKARRSCVSGKRCFGTRAAAVNYATKMMLRRPGSDKTPYVRPYLCECGWWHYTHQRPRQPQ